MTPLSASDAYFLLSRHPEITPEMIMNPDPYLVPNQLVRGIRVTDDFSGTVRDYVIDTQGRVWDITATDPSTGGRIDPGIAQQSEWELWWNSIKAGANESLNPFVAGSITNIALILGGAYLLWQSAKKK